MLYILALFLGVASAVNCKGPLPKGVVSCAGYKGVCGGAKCRTTQGWYSKINKGQPNQRVNTHKICQDKGYAGAHVANFGGNWGQQCRHPGNTRNLYNKAGGNLNNLGYTVTWQCRGTSKCFSGPAPTSAPGSGCGKVPLPSPVVRCNTYKGGECVGKGAGCVTGPGWFSKDNVSNPNQRVNAQAICKAQGYEGAHTTLFGGNWGHQCRHPGNSKALTNKAGGALTNLGYTVTWKCVGTCKIGPVTQKPTAKPATCGGKALPSPVVRCATYKGGECTGKGAGCVKGLGWFSKDNVSNPNQRVNAQQICRDQGYAQGADTTQFGGNWGHQCRHPGNSGNLHNKAGGSLTYLGYTVTWRCKGTCSAPVTAKPTPPTGQCGKATLPTRVVRCNTYKGGECVGKGAGCVTGPGWFSKDNVSNPNQRVNAQQICRDQGYAQGASTTQYGGNWGHQCRHPGTSKAVHNKAGGALTNLGYTVTWKCMGTCGPTTSKPTSAACPRPSLPTSKVLRCVDYVKRSDAECRGRGAGCVQGEGWFSKDNTVNPYQRVNADQICKSQGFAQGADTVMFGGNWGHQCRHPGTSINVFNKAGGALTNLGYTVTWKCKGTCGPVTAKPTPPPSPKPTGCTKATLPSKVIRCSTYNGYECKGKGFGCVEGPGWFSKDNTVQPQQRVNADAICKAQGYSGASKTMYGGNWGMKCRHPGTAKNTFNKAGGALTALGYTVTWRCEGSCDPVTMKPTPVVTKKPTPAPSKPPTSKNPTPAPIVVTAKPTEEPKPTPFPTSAECFPVKGKCNYLKKPKKLGKFKFKKLEDNACDCWDACKKDDATTNAYDFKAPSKKERKGKVKVKKGKCTCLNSEAKLSSINGSKSAKKWCGGPLARAWCTSNNDNLGECFQG